MFKGLGNIASLLSQAHTIGPKMEQISNELKSKTVTGSAGGGMVTVSANGLGQVLQVIIDPVLMEKADIEMVRDLLPAAINQAIAKAKQMHVDAMKSLTGGLSLPGLDDAINQFTGNMPGADPVDDGDDSSGQG